MVFNLVKGGVHMPVIIFEGPKMTKEQKQELVKEFSAIGSRITNLPQSAFITLLNYPHL